MLQQINHGISTGVLFLIVGVIYERRHTREISEYGGLSNVMPIFATIYHDHDPVSSMGLPLLNGFIGEFTILQGAFMENMALGGLGGARRRARRGVPALALPARDLRHRSRIRRTRSCRI